MKKHYRKFTPQAYGKCGDSMKPACGQYTAHITKDCTPIMDEVTCAKCLKALAKCGYMKPNSMLYVKQQNAEHETRP